jgi:hypothetical protein
LSPAADVAGSAKPEAAVGEELASRRGDARSAAMRGGAAPEWPASLRWRASAARCVPLLPVLAFAVAGVVLAAYQPAAAAAETLHLALVGACALAGAALLGCPRGLTAASGPLLAELVLWALPAGPERGVAFGVVVVGAVLVAGWQRLRAVELGESDGRRGTGLDAAAAIGGALALHALLRAGELLPAVLFHATAASAAAVARLLLPPVLAGLALAELARRVSPRAAFTAGAGVALAAQGFTVTAALPLLALAAAEAARAWRDEQRNATEVDRNATRDAGSGGREGRQHDRAARASRAGAVALACALAALGLAIARPAAGALAFAAAALWVLPRTWGWVAAAAPLAYGLVAHGEPQRLFELAALVALLPWAFLPRGAAPRHLLGAVLVGAGGTLLLPGAAGLAAAAAALALATDAAGARGSLQRDSLQRGSSQCGSLQLAWLGTLLAIGALAASYPWLRAQPLGVALAAVGLPAILGWREALLTAVLPLAGAALLLLAEARFSTRLAAGLLAAGLVAAVLIAMPPPARNVVPADAVALRSDAPEWRAVLDGPPVERVRVVSTLADGAELPAGTAVATLSLEREGRPLAAWTLRAGTNTAEWAADRPDLRGVAAAGPIWWSWLPPPGTFYAHAYASTWRLSRPVAADHVRVARDPALPPSVTLSLLRVEVSP